jgi:hypothetical protein
MRLMRFSPLLILVAVGGCGLFTNDNFAPLVPDVRSPIVDVPVPAGFTMSSISTSRMTAQGTARQVDHYYTGQENYMAVANFYRMNLPDKGWTWIDQTQPTGIEVIEHFSNKSEICAVTVTKRVFDTMIHIQIGPPTP